MISILFFIAVFCCILSQCPQFLGSSTPLALQATLGVVAICLFLRKGFTLFTRRLIYIYIGLAIFAFYLLICTTFTDNKFYFNIDFTNLSMAMCICIISYVWWSNYRHDNNKIMLAIIIILACLVLSYFIYNLSLRDLDLGKRHEMYSSKNSAAQIIFAGATVGIICLHPQKLTGKILLWATCIAMSVMVFMLRSRATIVSWGVAAVYLIFSNKDKRMRWLLIVVVAALVAVIVTTPEYYKVIFDQILLAGRDQNDLNDVSSGRVEIIGGLVESFLKSPIIGIGRRYVDCMPFAMLLQYGIIGFTIMMIFLYKIFKVLWDIRNYNDVTKCAFVLLLSYLANSIFEAQTPFGPGAKCLILWIFYGMALATYNIKKKQTEQTKLICSK